MNTYQILQTNVCQGKVLDFPKQRTRNRGFFLGGGGGIQDCILKSKERILRVFFYFLLNK